MSTTALTAVAGRGGGSLFAAEALKLRTTRPAWAVSGGVLLVIVLAVVVSALAGEAQDDGGRSLLTFAGLAHVAACVVGLLAVTSEVRHGTLTPTLLVTPRRSRVVLAKVAAHGLGGLALGFLAFGLAAAVGLPLLAARDIPSGLDAPQVAAIVAGGTLGTALFAVLGVGFGALVRHQAGAIVGALAWVYAVESMLGLLPGIGSVVQTVGLAGLSSALSDTLAADPSADLLGQVPAGLMLAVYAAAMVAAGARSLARYDITG